MNPDLELRLKSLNDLTNLEVGFLQYLIEYLSEGVCRVNVKFEEIEGEDDSAYVIGDGSNFDVVIDPRMPFGMCVDFLIHELAHIFSWEKADPEEDHCDEFGKAYADLYRFYLYLYDKYWERPRNVSKSQTPFYGRKV